MNSSALARRLPPQTLAAALFALLAVAALVSVTQGPVALPLRGALAALLDAATGVGASELPAYQRAVVLELRLPRTLLAIGAGALLAQSGAVMQGLFRNPLADPGIVGVSAGAAAGAVLGLFFLPAGAGPWLQPLCAFGGGFAATLFVYHLARGSTGTSVLVLLLAGVAVAALAGSLIGLLSYLSDDSRLRDISVWQMGSLALADDARIAACFAVLALLCWRFQRRASGLNAFLLGEAEARHLGIDTEAMKRELIVLVALGVGVAVAAAGLIGFVGLVVPHALRLLVGPDHRSLLPLSALGGAVLLLGADAAARLLIAPAELPVGILTALLGAPFFVLLLLQQRERTA